LKLNIKPLNSRINNFKTGITSIRHEFIFKWFKIETSELSITFKEMFTMLNSDKELKDYLI